MLLSLISSLKEKVYFSFIIFSNKNEDLRVIRKQENHWVDCRSMGNVRSLDERSIWQLHRLVEVGCLEGPRASTFGSQSQDWKTPPWLAQRCNPAMSCHAQETKNRHPSHWKNSAKKKGGGGELDDDCFQLRWLTETPRTAWPMPHKWKTAQLRMCLKTDLWPRALLALFVVNSFKLHLNTLMRRR